MKESINEEQVHLPPLLDEFRSVLQDEIEFAKRNASSNSVPLSNGHKVGQQGSAFQYAFLIDTVLNTPDGAPCDFVVTGHKPIAATIVSTEGLRIVISIEIDLGQFVPLARLQTNLTILMRKLIERIEANASANNRAASRMLGLEAVTGDPKKPSGEILLNEEQMDALESALGRNLTVIWGPPGTGKTRTIGTIAEQLFNKKRTVLIVSHTNTAVDQAIKNIAESLNNQLESGAVIRVGEVKDEVLRVKYPDVLVRSQVERQSRELIEQRDSLMAKRQDITDDLNDVKRKISVLEWLQASEPEIKFVDEKLAKLQELQGHLVSSEQDLQGLKPQQQNLLQSRELTTRILDLRKEIDERKNMLAQLNAQLSKVESQINENNGYLQQQQSRLETVERITPLRNERATYPALEEQKSIIQTLSEMITELDRELNDRQRRYVAANNSLEKLKNTNSLVRIVRRLPKPGEQIAVIDKLLNEITGLEVERNATLVANNNAGEKLSRILEIGVELSRYENIGTKSEEQKKQNDIQYLLRDLRNRRFNLIGKLTPLATEIEELEMDEKQQSGVLDGDPKIIYAEVSSKLRHLRDLEDQVTSIRTATTKLESDVDNTISSLLNQALEWTSVANQTISIYDKYRLFRECYQKLSKEYHISELQSLIQRAEHLHSNIRQLTSNISEIDNTLAQVEKNVINNVSIVGATLTKTYLSDAIQARRFDTVILDEASMAPIPALWFAALLSEHNLIIVGDFKQLPPIVLSNREATRKWLGRDIFEASGLITAWNKGNPPDYFIQLTHQHRMVSKIAEVANQFYDHRLITLEKRHPDVDKFLEWYKIDWPYDKPVILVDTGSLNAWVTSVVKGGNSSRLNFLSATVSVDLAEQLLNPDRPKHKEGEPKRILIISPYRAHAKLVNVLLRENDQIQDEVYSGTAHSFQGSEADVVIFDLVADEPHFRVNLFIPALDEQLKPLLNVALTRARFRLFILGDFNYCQSQGKKAFLGRTLIPFLVKSFPRVNALDLIPNGLAARAAKAQMSLLGGEIELDSKRVVVTQADFFRLLSTDLIRAKKRVIIYSPFLTQDRVAFLMPHLQAAVSRNVLVVIITKSFSERSGSEIGQIRRIEAQFAKIGVIVVHKMHMHEKLVFIDDDITWSGSLNPLSYTNTQEVMERRKSKPVLDDYFNILRLPEILAIQGKPESKCPICGSEIMAAEGADQPYYWRCINKDCYSRSIDQPYPFDGVVVVKGKCQGLVFSDFVSHAP